MDYTGYVNIMQAATITGMSRRTIYNWIKTKKVEAIRTSGGQIRINPKTLFKSIDRQPLSILGDFK